MLYKIAVGSSDGKNVDLKFGAVQEFLIFEVDLEGYRLLERRQVIEKDGAEEESGNSACSSSSCEKKGCSGNGALCSGPSEISNRISVIEDCRCIVCKKVGFQAQKQFEKKAISVFDVDCEVLEALRKIVFYYSKIDRHESIRSINK